MWSNGPLWYRGYVKKEIDTKVIKTILDIFNVDHDIELRATRILKDFI